MEIKGTNSDECKYRKSRDKDCAGMRTMLLCVSDKFVTKKEQTENVASSFHGEYCTMECTVHECLKPLGFEDHDSRWKHILWVCWRLWWRPLRYGVLPCFVGPHEYNSRGKSESGRRTDERIASGAYCRSCAMYHSVWGYIYICIFVAMIRNGDDFDRTMGHCARVDGPSRACRR